MPEPSALPWKVAAEKAAGELDIEKFRYHVLAQKPQYFSGFRNCPIRRTIVKNAAK
jgi:hypothetical protein